MPLTTRTTQVLQNVISDPRSSVEILAFFNNPASLGLVTSVGLAAPAQFTVSGSPVTGASTITLDWATQAMNVVWCGPANGVDAKPTFRNLVVQDIPTLPYSKITNLANDLSLKAPIDSPVFTTSVTFADGVDLDVGSGSGCIIGLNSGRKIGFYGATPIVRPSGDILTALGTSGLGLISAPTILESDVSGLTGDLGSINSSITSINSSLALKAPLASPALTGTPTAPTPTTGDSSTKVATTSFVGTAVSNATAALNARALATITYLGGF